MDSKARLFEPINVEMIGIEDGFERFQEDGIAIPPPIARWRSNLTALSQRYNLFFIASNDRIAVFQPQFPYQILGRRHALLIKPDVANPDALGYMSSHRDDEDHHCIDRLIVGELGSQEVLVIATDSGNISAYYTTSVLEAIHRAPEQLAGNSTSDLLGLRPFFTHWVRQSAWGIDLHKSARMIAVSSNVPNRAQPANSTDTSAVITIFAFALAPMSTSDSESESEASWSSSMDGKSPDGNDTAEWLDWSADMAGPKPTRDRNYKIVLAGWAGHENNIPNISFVNASSEDTEDVWILSTDITGSMKLWQIWKMSCIRTWSFGTPEHGVRPWFDHQFPGWNVIALNPDCFRLARTNEEFIGSQRAPVYHGYLDSGPSYNMTNVINHVPESSQVHPAHPDRGNEDLWSDDERIYNDNDSDDDDDDEDDVRGERVLGVDSMDYLQSPMYSPPLIPDFSSLSAEHSASFSRELERFERPIVFDIETDQDSFSDEESDMEDQLPSPISNSPRSPSNAPLDSRMQRHIRRQVTPIQNPNLKLPNVAIIHCSNSHVRLLGSPRARFPHWFCANMLRQIMPSSFQATVQGFNFVHMDRLIMHHIMPELGVLLIATQTGRVAVCALTRRPDGLLGMRVDWVLPTKRQERRGRRPELCPLIGLAVSPIQGREEFSSDYDGDSTSDQSEFPRTNSIEIDGVPSSFDDKVVILHHPTTPQERHAWTSKNGTPPEPRIETKPWTKLRETEEWKALETSRRYRLMLTYSDLTVLTYEISRGIEKGDAA